MLYLYYIFCVTVRHTTPTIESKLSKLETKLKEEIKIKVSALDSQIKDSKYELQAKPNRIEVNVNNATQTEGDLDNFDDQPGEYDSMFQ